MDSLSHASDDRQTTTGPPWIALVDPAGYTVPLNERFEGPEPDASDPAEWDPTADNWFWTISDPAELDEEPPDAPDARRPGPAYQPTAEDLADYAAWADAVDRMTDLLEATDDRLPPSGGAD